MAAGTFTLFDSFALRMADGTIDLDSHTFKMSLHTSSFVPSVSTMAVHADLTNEVANANGYTTGGISLTSVTYTLSAAVAKFTSAAPVWTAAGGSITARYAVIYDDTSTNKDLIGYFLLDVTPADVTVTDTNTLTVNPNAAGWFTTTVN